MAACLTNFFEDHPLAVLATEARGQPYASLMIFVATEDLRQLIMTTKRETQKYRNLVWNHRVSLLIDNRKIPTPDREDGDEPAIAVTVLGKASEVEGPAHDILLTRFLKRHPQMVAFATAPGSALIRVEVESYQVVEGLGDVTTWHP